MSHNPSTFWDHLEILRWGLIRVLCVMGVCLVGIFVVMPAIFDRFILAPTTSGFFVYRWIEYLSDGLMTFDKDFSVQIININITSQFMTHVTASLGLAAVVTFPYILYEIWRFIRPALYPTELRHVRIAFVCSSVMFYVGCAVGYLLIFPFMFRFLAEYELSRSIVNQINLRSYMDNFTCILLMMGVLFEMPLLAWLLSCLGIVRRSMLQRYKRHAIVALLVLAAIITPSGDPFTLLVVFLPLYLLYVASVCVARK